MKLAIRLIILTALALGAISSAAAGDQTEMVVAIATDDNSEETRIELNSDELGFNMQDMQEGENRSVVDKNGQTVLITREADGFRFDVNGKTIRMPAFDGGAHGKHHEFIEIDGTDGDVIDVRVMKNKHVAMMQGPEHVMIMSGKPIDDTTQQAIKTLLESAGHTSDVRFIDHETHKGGPHKIRIVEKRVDVSE